jgi:hypothetical protein
VALPKTQGRVVDGLLAVLAEGPVKDPNGFAARVLLPKTGYGSPASLSAVLYRLEAQGLVHRKTRNKRTFSIELTPAGRAHLGAPAAQPQKPTRTVAAMPPGPASAWTDQTLAAPPPSSFDAPPPKLPTATGADLANGSSAIDYDLLAGVLLKKALQALQAPDNRLETERLKALVAKEQSRRQAAESAAGAAKAQADTAESRIAELEEELADLKGRNFGLDTELRITRQNVETLTKRLGIAERRRTDISPDEEAGLNSLQRELAKIMVQPPGR